MNTGKIISDEFGLSFEIRPEDVEISGYDCVETNSRAIFKIASMLRTSLGPNGMDKIIVDCDNQITMTNDGATIIKEYVSNNSGGVMELVKQLALAQESEIGDGTTSIVLMANGLLQGALKLLKVGMHPIRVIEGFNNALKFAIEEIQNNLCEKIDDKTNYCLRGVETSLNSKITSKYRELGDICVNAVCAVADLERKDVDLDRVNVKILKGGFMDETELIKGVLLEKKIEGEGMILGKKDKLLKICLLACPFEPPRLKTKNNMIVSTVTQYEELSEYERSTFKTMICKVKEVGADIVLCQWGFDDEATSMLFEHGLPAIRWVGGHDLGHIAALTNAKIISRFENLTPECLGEGFVEVKYSGTENQKFVYITSMDNKISTILIKSSNKFISEEIERSVRDAICVARNILISDKIVYGGGSLECSLYKIMNNYDKANNHILDLLNAEDVACFKAFSTGLLEIPIILAENAGLDFKYVESILNARGNQHYGIPSKETDGLVDMKTENVFESVESKVRQITMAVDYVNTILKIHDVIKQ